jgi:hypothetical protein
MSNDRNDHQDHVNLVDLDEVDAARREVLRRLITGAAVAAPVICSFSISGLGLRSAYAGTISFVCTPRDAAINPAICPSPAPPSG